MRKQRFQRVRQQFVKFLRILPERNDRTRNSLTTASVRGQPVKYITFLFKPLQSTAKLTGRVTIVCVDASPRPASFATLYSNLPSPSLCVFVRVPCGPNLVHLALWHQKKNIFIFPPVLPAPPSECRPHPFHRPRGCHCFQRHPPIPPSLPYLPDPRETVLRRNPLLMLHKACGPCNAGVKTKCPNKGSTYLWGRDDPM